MKHGSISLALAAFLLPGISASFSQQEKPNLDRNLDRNCSGISVLRNSRHHVVWFDHEKMKSMAIKKVAPKLSGDEFRMEGTVILNIVVGTTGKVECIWVVSGHPIAIAPAMSAARQWEFKPMTVKARPIGFAGTLRLRFSTSHGNGY